METLNLGGHHCFKQDCAIWSEMDILSKISNKTMEQIWDAQEQTLWELCVNRNLQVAVFYQNFRKISLLFYEKL